MSGLFTTTGVQQQPFVADAAVAGSWLRTARAAITRLEAEGHVPAAFLVSPGDWEAAETSRVSTGHLDLGNLPVDSATRRLWGVPAVVCQSLDDGQAVLLGAGCRGTQHRRSRHRGPLVGERRRGLQSQPDPRTL